MVLVLVAGPCRYRETAPNSTRTVDDGGFSWLVSSADGEIDELVLRRFQIEERPSFMRSGVVASCGHGSTTRLTRLGGFRSVGRRL